MSTHEARRRVITDRGDFLPLAGIVATTLIVLGYNAGAGALPSPVVLASLYLIGIGLGLVLARAGRLGPYEGTFGSPWFENELDDLLNRESARAIGYGRDLTIVAIHQKSKQLIEWGSHVRSADCALRCRRKWTILILPETTENTAIELLCRARLTAPSEFQAAMVSISKGAKTLEPVGVKLVEAIHNTTDVGSIIANRQGKLQNLSLAS